MSETTESTVERKAERYEPGAIERKWQAYWELHKTFATPGAEAGDKPKAYILDMFPYPSGAGLHVGHPEGYTATDIVARFRRANGYAVLHPMGWDAFGLPAEQYAIRTGTHPAVTTASNIATFRRQLKMLGFSYDWDREVDTTDPAYVRWTQWIFLKLFHRGLAYQDSIPVNWCPALGTVLANEEVKDGLSERGSHPVVRLPLRQWILRITKYADRLLEDLPTDWPEGIRAMQGDWIGRSEGAEVRFPVDGLVGEVVEVFTTRPDTLYGATFMVLAPEHALVDRVTTAERRADVERYVAATRGRSELDRTAAKDKTGVFTGGHVLHPLTGAKVPIWIADYVLATYGTGAIMAVPAHDERDFAFARKHGIPVVEVVSQTGTPRAAELAEAFTGDGIAVRSGPYDGLPTLEFKRKITTDLETSGKGRGRIEYKLRDWVFARQRYWGEPIPIYFPVETTGDPRKGDAFEIRYDQPIPLQESELPLRLPDLEDYQPTGDPDGPLVKAADWRFFQKGGRWYARETNTMPQWAGSCWYYLRFMDPKNDKEPWSQESARRWLPVDLYVGGAEHAVLHLLYARFWHKVLYDEGLVPCLEPFSKLVNQGMILGETEYWVRPPMEWKQGVAYLAGTDSFWSEYRVPPTEVEKRPNGWVHVASGYPVVTVQPKMSKARGNVVNPDDIVREQGADSLRLFEMFMGPLEATKPWNTEAVTGVRRFLERVWHLAQRPRTDAGADDALARLIHKTVRKVTGDIEALRFNTAISALMVLTNEVANRSPVPTHALETIALLLHPFAPHLAEEVWEALGHPPSIQAAAWPTFDPAMCEDPEVEIPVQVNGKVRGKVKVPADADEALVLEHARAAVTAHLAGKTVAKEVYVSGKIVTIVVK